MSSTVELGRRSMTNYAHARGEGAWLIPSSLLLPSMLAMVAPCPTERVSHNEPTSPGHIVNGVEIVANRRLPVGHSSLQEASLGRLAYPARQPVRDGAGTVPMTVSALSVRRLFCCVGSGVGCRIVLFWGVVGSAGYLFFLPLSSGLSPLSPPSVTPEWTPPQMRRALAGENGHWCWKEIKAELGGPGGLAG